jgi:hypothetical protein
MMIDFGTYKVLGNVLIKAADTLDNKSGLSALIADIQKAMANTVFKVTTSATGTPALNSDFKLNASTPEVELFLTPDGRFTFTSGGYKITLQKTGSVNANLLGLTQLATADATSIRNAAIDASARGSVVNIGDQNASGQITLKNWVRAYQAINLYSSTSNSGNQNLDFGPTGILETLSGDIVMNPADSAVIKGDLIARGYGANVIINAKNTLDLRGQITAQKDIRINAGTTVKENEISVSTYGTARFTTLDTGGTIGIAGLNDVLINSTVGINTLDPTVNSALKAINIESKKGKLTIAKESGWVQTGAELTLKGKTLDLAGVVRSTRATDALYDNEVTISADDAMSIHGDLQVAGSLLMQSGGSIDIYNTTLLANADKQRLTVNATGNVNIGSVNPVAGVQTTKAAVLEGNALLSMTIGGDLNLAADASLLSSGTSSKIQIKTGGANIVGKLPTVLAVQFG